MLRLSRCGVKRFKKTSPQWPSSVVILSTTPTLTLTFIGGTSLFWRHEQFGLSVDDALGRCHSLTFPYAFNAAAPLRRRCMARPSLWHRRLKKRIFTPGI